MKRFAILTTAAALAAIVNASAALAQMGTASEGRSLAMKSCSECHNVGQGDADAKAGPAPAFAAIASMRSATLLSIKVFLRTPHANMPNIMLGESEIDAVAEYIMSLKKN